MFHVSDKKMVGKPVQIVKINDEDAEHTFSLGTYIINIIYINIYIPYTDESDICETLLTAKNYFEKCELSKIYL